MSERWLWIERGTRSGRFYLAPIGKFYDRGYTIGLPHRRSLPAFPTPEQLGSLVLELLPRSGFTHKSISEYENLKEDAESKAAKTAKLAEERHGFLTCQLETRDGQKSYKITPYTKTERYKGPYRGIKEGQEPFRVSTSVGVEGLGRALLGALQLGGPDPKRVRLFGPEPPTYHHWFFVRDLDWTGSKVVFEQIHQVLARHGLAEEKPVSFDLAGGMRRRVKKSLARAKQVPDDLLLEYGPVSGSAIKKVVGGRVKSLSNARVVLGLDYKLCHVYGQFTTGVAQPPKRGGKKLEPYRFDRGKRGSGFAGFPSATAPPTTLVAPLPPGELEPPSSFHGCWRSGVGFEFEPAKRSHGPGAAAWSPQFVDDLGQALGTELVNFGWRV